MAHVVVFRLEAPIAAFGELAVGERRGSRRRPAASAILGLIAAALGIGRDDPGHDELAAAWRIAVRTDRIGAPLADFHTAQTPAQKRGRHYATRREELADRLELGTIVSRRDHYTDAAFTVALWPADGVGAESTARRIAEALNRPRWALFVGRRACPPSRPVAALVVVSETLAAAFDAFDAADDAARAKAVRPLPASPKGSDFAFDAEFREGALAEAAADFVVVAREVARDAIADRARRQFGLRAEIVARRISIPEARP